MTDRNTGSGSPPGFTPRKGGRPPPGGLLWAWAQRATLVVLLACVLPSPPLLLQNPEPHSAVKEIPLQHRAGGTRWLESHNNEVVHFVCEPGAPYTVSLVSASLAMAGVPLDERSAYLHALREAVEDWRDVLRCPRIRAEMDSPDADTQVVFRFIDNPGTLATGTRAQHIVLNAARAWFPGTKHVGNFSGRERAVSFYWVVAHELGHVWGLAHSDSPQSLMYPSQCETCRWSSFEQAAGNLIHAASLVPDWSRPHWTNRFFVKTPLAVVERLLTGELPDEPLWSALAEGCTDAGDGAPRDERWDVPGCGFPELTPRSSLQGMGAVRHLRRTTLSHHGTRIGAEPRIPAEEPWRDRSHLPESAETGGELPAALPPRWSTPEIDEWLMASCLV